jgi:transcriptional regulator with XRE-family HTH domain
MAFPAKLKELRLARNLTQEQLAELIGISIKAYRNYESGKTVPRIPVIRKLVIALETTADELLEIE